LVLFCFLFWLWIFYLFFEFCWFHCCDLISIFFSVDVLFFFLIVLIVQKSRALTVYFWIVLFEAIVHPLFKEIFEFWGSFDFTQGFFGQFLQNSENFEFKVIFR
jgi:hypothetical protein